MRTTSVNTASTRYDTSIARATGLTGPFAASASARKFEILRYILRQKSARFKDHRRCHHNAAQLAQTAIKQVLPATIIPCSTSEIIEAISKRSCRRCCSC